MKRVAMPPRSLDGQQLDMADEQIARRSDEVQSFWIVPESIPVPLISRKQGIAPFGTHEGQDLYLELAG
jgi:hypothetical protein